MAKGRKWSDDMTFEARIALVKKAMDEHHGNVTHAAKALGMTRTNLSQFVSRHVHLIGSADVVVCPKCSTRIRLRAALGQVTRAGRPRTVNGPALTGA